MGGLGTAVGVPLDRTGRFAGGEQLRAALRAASPAPVGVDVTISNPAARVGRSGGCAKEKN